MATSDVPFTALAHTVPDGPGRRRRSVLWRALLLSGAVHLLLLIWWRPPVQGGPGATAEVQLQLANAMPATAGAVRQVLRPQPASVPATVVTAHAAPSRIAVRPPRPPLAATPAATAAAPRQVAATVPPPVPVPSTQPLDAYARQLQAWLARHRDYPRAARRAGIEGEVVLQFVLGADGRPRLAQVERSSGAAILDRAALDLLARASPLPPPPLSGPGAGSEVQLQVPVRYRLDAH